jgi:hypothetical protein
MADDKLSRTVTKVMRELQDSGDNVPGDLPGYSSRRQESKAREVITEAGYKSVEEFLELVADRATYKFVYFSWLGKLL